MKRIIVLYNSKCEKGFENFCKAKSRFYYELNKNSVTAFKKAKHHFQLGNIRFDFLDVSKRNTEKFLKNNPGMIETVFTFIDTIDRSYLKFLNKLEPKTNKIQFVKRASEVDLIRYFYSFHEEIEVYTISEDKYYKKELVWNFQFDESKHFLTREEVKSAIKELAQKRIENWNYLIKQETAFLNSLA